MLVLASVAGYVLLVLASVAGYVMLWDLKGCGFPGIRLFSTLGKNKVLPAATGSGPDSDIRLCLR